MRFYRYPEEIIRLLGNTYKDTVDSVKVCGELSDQLKTIVGELQGCALSSLLFNIFLELVIATAMEDEEIGMQIGGVQINDFHFSDDTALLAESPNVL